MTFRHKDDIAIFTHAYPSLIEEPVTLPGVCSDEALKFWIVVQKRMVARTGNLRTIIICGAGIIERSDLDRKVI